MDGDRDLPLAMSSLPPTARVWPRTARDEYVVRTICCAVALETQGFVLGSRRLANFEWLIVALMILQTAFWAVTTVRYVNRTRRRL